MLLDKLRGMAVFASVVQHGSFSGAGKELGITTSAVSQQIRSLEQDLGVVLLQRSTRKFSLTEAGESLYKSAQQIIHSAEEGRNKVSQLRHDVSGLLRIATLPQIAHKYLLPALSGWFDEHEELSVHFIALSCKVDMIDDRVDLAVVLTPQPSPENTVLTEVKQMVLASPKYLNGRTVDTLDDVLQHNFITCGSTDILGVTKDDKTENIKVNSNISSDHSQLSLELAIAGYGLVRSNELEAQDAIRAGLLVPVLTDYHLPNLFLTAQTNTKNPPAKVVRCIDILKEYFTTAQAI
ncbi:LysR family transcriptional regulator [Moraxella oblonga]|uniref:LysR family transcriptional regulator n=1 Tax=Moraxella oblonga TaxID=200413 RepID=UPI0008297A46|nr:LysR family transcriptional regulator [Moraxella oblonga]